MGLRSTEPRRDSARACSLGEEPGLSPKGAGEPQATFEQGKDRARCLFYFLLLFA